MIKTDKEIYWEIDSIEDKMRSLDLMIQGAMHEVQEGTLDRRQEHILVNSSFDILTAIEELKEKFADEKKEDESNS